MLLQLEMSTRIPTGIQENSSPMKGHLNRVLTDHQALDSGEGIPGWWNSLGRTAQAGKCGHMFEVWQASHTLSEMELLVRNSRRLGQTEEGIECQTER